MRRPMTLGQVIRNARRSKGWTQEALAVMIDDGMTQPDVSRLERDKITLPRRDRLQRIARALDMPLGEFLAKSGWAAADRFFDAPPIDNREVLANQGAQQGNISPGAPSSIASSRLQEALSQSRVLREQTDQLLQQSRNAVWHWEHSLERQEPGNKSNSDRGDR